MGVTAIYPIFGKHGKRLARRDAWLFPCEKKYQHYYKHSTGIGHNTTSKKESYSLEQSSKGNTILARDAEVVVDD